MINIVDKELCCGCNACGDVCTKDAIRFQADNEGFLYPVVDESKCVDCRLCEKVCPIQNIDSIKHNDFWLFVQIYSGRQKQRKNQKCDG